MSPCLYTWMIILCKQETLCKSVFKFSLVQKWHKIRDTEFLVDHNLCFTLNHLSRASRSCLYHVPLLPRSVQHFSGFSFILSGGKDFSGRDCIWSGRLSDVTRGVHRVITDLNFRVEMEAFRTLLEEGSAPGAHIEGATVYGVGHDEGIRSGRHRAQGWNRWGCCDVPRASIGWGRRQHDP